MKILSITLLMIISLNCLTAASYTVKANTAGNMGSQIGKSFSESFIQSFNDSYYDTTRKQRELDQYEKMLEIHYRAQLKAQREFDAYQRELEINNYK